MQALAKSGAARYKALEMHAQNAPSTGQITTTAAVSARLNRADRLLIGGAVLLFLGAGAALWITQGPSVFGAMITGLLSLCF
jgi:hypothetical protein